MHTLLMIIAIIILTINIILTILEAIQYYQVHYSCGANAGRIRGASELISTGPATTRRSGRIKLGGMWYNVEWIILGKVGVLYNEEKEN